MVDDLDAGDRRVDRIAVAQIGGDRVRTTEHVEPSYPVAALDETVDEAVAEQTGAAGDESLHGRNGSAMDSSAEAQPRIRLRRSPSLWQLRGVAAVSEAPARCLLCGSTRSVRRYRLSRRSIRRCATCGLVFLWPLPTEAEIDAEFAELYETGDSPLPELRDYYRFCFDDTPDNPLVATYERWLAALERYVRPGRIADVGCGTGLFLAVARRRGWEPTGVDASVDATRHAREHFGLDVRTGDFAEVLQAGERFDAVTMWDVIEHARDPVGLLRAAHGCLAPRGVLGLATPNQRSILDVVAGALYRASGGRIVAPLEKFYIDQHFAYFTDATLAEALRRAGLSLALVERESTELRRLRLRWPVRMGLQTMFAVARWTGLENRLFAVARVEAA